MKINIILFVFAILAIQSCSSFQNKQVEIAKAEVEKQIKEQSKDNLQLASFEKTDGKEIQNQRYQYELEFKAKMTIKNNCLWIIGSPTLAEYGRPFSVMNESGKDNVSAGEIVDFRGVVYLEKKESGWNVFRIELEPKL